MPQSQGRGDEDEEEDGGGAEAQAESVHGIVPGEESAIDGDAEEPPTCRAVLMATASDARGRATLSKG